MKIVIDIPIEMIEASKTDLWCGSPTVGDAIKHGTPYEEMPQWISCTERLPNAECGESNSVLCQLENDTMKVLYWNGGNWRNPTGELYHSVNHKNGWHNRVIAWMPLPDPYKKEGGADNEVQV